MREKLAGVIILLVVAVTAAQASPAQTPVFSRDNPQGTSDVLRAPIFTRPASDTVWFGGCDPETHLALEGQFWDWDTDVAEDPFQGWTSRDLKAQTGTYFGRVTVADFTAHGDPCIAMLPPAPPDDENDGQLWLGVHQDEADERDFIAGMGYYDNFCQHATSPEFAFDPDVDAISISFEYFNDTEDAFDYVYVQVLTFDAGGLPVEEHEVLRFHGEIGAPDDPSLCSEIVNAGVLAPAASCRIRLHMLADGAASDQDGEWDSECGPFGCDNMTVTVGATADVYDWEIGEEGWTFDVCPGIGTFMGIVDAFTWGEWLEFAGVLCECAISGNALEFCDEEGSPHWPPGHPVGHEEMCVSNVIARDGTPYQVPDYNATIVRWHQYAYMRRPAGTFYRPGWMIYPFTSDANPEIHWSPRQGQDRYYFTGDVADCYLDGVSYSDPVDGTPIPADWDSLRVVYEIICSCDQFGIPPPLCQYEGETWGSPVIDNFRLGLTGAVDAPALSGDTGYQFQDGFGQNFPFYVEPCDVGNSNTVFDLSRDSDIENDWLGDSAVIVGPNVNDEEDRWACELCLRLAAKGPCQDRVPGYAEWKARLGGDPEVDWACVRLDSLETNQGVYASRYQTYFHEDDPGFDPTCADLSPRQEIAPDGIFTPGTEIEYMYRGWWWNGGAPPEAYYELGPWEFAILPGMEATGDQEGYNWQYPCVLYIDAYNRGSEYYINPLLEQMGLEYDKYDALDASSNWDGPINRSFGGTRFNPGGYGNSGCTVNQLLAYRMILVSTGAFGGGTWEHNGTVPAPNFVLLENWLDNTDCGLENTRRALVLNGDGITFIMADPTTGLHQDFANNVLGVTLEAITYSDYNLDMEYCVYVEPTAGAEFVPSFPGISLYGNGCPQVYDYNVLDVQPGVAGASGNLRYYSYLGTGTQAYVDFAEVIRDNYVPGSANWRSVVDGFSFHHVAERGFNGQDCSADSASILNGAANLMGPMLTWLQEDATRFQRWRYPCTDTGVDEEGQSHMAGPVNYLFKSRPNPFTSSAMIRFNLASECQANLAIYDVAGRLIKTLCDGRSAAGEHSLVWDGTDNAGRRLDSGIFWMRLQTENGYRSQSRIVVLQ